MRFLLALLIATPAIAHDAIPTAAQPDGWAYGVECCSIKDCWQEKDRAIRETLGGYLVVGTGEVIPYADRRIKRSRDEFFHRCAASGNPGLVHSICLYRPETLY